MVVKGEVMVVAKGKLLRSRWPRRSEALEASVQRGGPLGAI
jgi:hypothetical protein